MTQDNKFSADKTDGHMMKISLVSLVAALLFIIEMYEIINDPSNLIAIGAIGVFTLATVYADIFFIGKMIEKRAKDQKEAMDNVYRSEKASYLLMRKYFDKMEQKIDLFGEQAGAPYRELVSAQKALTKVQINHNKQNANALLISNEKMLQKISSFQKEIANMVNFELSEQDRAVFSEGNKDILEKQQELMSGLKELESSLKNEILESANKLASMKSQPMVVPEPQMPAQENSQLQPLHMDKGFSLDSDLASKKTLESSSESDLDKLLMEMNDEVSSVAPMAQETEFEPSAEEPELQPLLEEPELGPIDQMDLADFNDAVKPETGIAEDAGFSEEPELSPLLEEPELEPVEAFASEPLMEEPKLGPMEDTLSRSAILEPELGPMEDTLSQSAILEPELGPMEDTLSQSAILEPELGAIENILPSNMSEPELGPMEDILSQSAIPEPELGPIEDILSSNISEPELGPIEESAISEPELEPMEDILSQPAVEELAAETIVPEEMKPQFEQPLGLSQEEPRLEPLGLGQEEPKSETMMAEPEMIMPELQPAEPKFAAPQPGSGMKEPEANIIEPELDFDPDDIELNDPEIENIMKAMDIEDVSEKPVEDLDIDKILEVPLSGAKPNLSNSNPFMSSEEIAALIANTDLLSVPDRNSNDSNIPDLSDPGYVMSSDEIAALIANM